MPKKDALIVLATIFIACCGFMLYLYATSVATLPKTVETPILLEEDRINIEKEKDRQQMIEKLDEKKEKAEVLFPQETGEETPEEKEVMRLEMINDLNSIKEVEPELTTEEKEAARQKMIERLDSLKNE